MIGSIFYNEHKIVSDEKTGDFDREKAEELLRKEEEMSDMTGNPRIVDVCYGWPHAFEKFIDFVAETIDDPFALDGATARVKEKYGLPVDRLKERHKLDPTRYLLASCARINILVI